ncbi:MAG: WG repeat-containing protein [Bacteroidia bacterium]|nr:WG repeat-containing protein [Bacteroidia bacterium]
MTVCLPAQVPQPFVSGNKWGYKLNGKVLIAPQYDTAFPFDNTGSIAMAGINYKGRTEINQLTLKKNSRRIMSLLAAIITGLVYGAKDLPTV